MEITPFLTAEQIDEKIAALAQQIESDFPNEPITLIGTLKGSVIFFSDLARKIKNPTELEFLGTSSYGTGTHSSGQVKLTLDLHAPIEGKNVILVEDIVDTGLTLSFLLDLLNVRKPKRLKTVALLQKPDALKVPGLTLDYVGFQIPNHFVVGYGLDYNEKLRGLPFIGILKL